MSHSIFDSINMDKISLFTKYVFFVVVCVLMMTGCVEEYEAELPEKDTHLLVVNGTICSNQHNQFRLTLSTFLKNESSDLANSSLNESLNAPVAVSGAKVTICGTDGTEYECTEGRETDKRPKKGTYDEYSGLYEYYNSEYGYYYTSDEEEYEEYSYGTGVYSCDVPELNPDVSYFLTIKYWEDVYQSTPEKPIRTPEIERMEYFQKDSLSGVEILLTTEAPDAPDETTYFIWDYDETWEVRPTRFSPYYFASGVTFRTNEKVFPKRGWKFGRNETILVGSTAHYADGRFVKYQLLNIPRDDERISWLYYNNLRQRAICKAEYEYLSACKQAGWQMGGLFTPQPSALPTNIRCVTSSKRAIGYIGCSLNNHSMPIYVDGTKISRILPEPAPIVELRNCTVNDNEKMEERGMVLDHWDGSAKEPTNTYWGYLIDYDVREQGATVEKPIYMPPFDEE